MTDAELLATFVGAFGKFEPLHVRGGWKEMDNVPVEMQDGFDGSPAATPMWKPAVVSTPRSSLDNIYRRLPGKFPRLYEDLILSYRWLEIDLDDIITLYANPSLVSLDPLLDKMIDDPVLTRTLFPRGWIPFGHPPQPSYDPICFVTDKRRPDGDCPIIRVEHESILSFDKIGDVWPVANSFREFVHDVIHRAENPH